MDFNNVLQAISTVGFPIVACAAMFWKINKQDESHKEEIDKLSGVIENNNIAITHLTDTIEDLTNTK